MRVNWISSIQPLIELFGLVLNIRIIKQKEYVRLLLSDLQRSGTEHWCTVQGKNRNNVKTCLDLTNENHSLLLKGNNPVKANNDVLWTLIVVWKSSKRMNYDEIVFSLHWKIWKKNYRLIKTFYLHICCFIASFYYWFLILVIFSVHRSCSVKKVVLRNFAKLTGNICASVSFLTKLKAYNFIEKKILAQVFSCDFWKISKNNFSTEHLPTTTSVFDISRR